MIIRPFRPNDLDACVAIVTQCWDRSAGKNARSQIVDGHYFVAEIDDKVVGFCGVRPSFIMRNAWEVPWIAVSPDHHGKAIGRRVLERALGEAGRRHGSLILLVTQEDGFFAKAAGFNIVERYNDDWSLMTLRLTSLGMSSLVA